jgi:hypothetical protein
MGWVNRVQLAPPRRAPVAQRVVRPVGQRGAGEQGPNQSRTRTAWLTQKVILRIILAAFKRGRARGESHEENRVT